MSEPLGKPVTTFSGDFADVESFLASDWSDRTFYAASAEREGYDNAEAARMLKERAAGRDVPAAEWDERLGAISELTFVMAWVGDEEFPRFRRLYDEFSDSTARQLLAGEGPLHVECETTVYEDV